MLSNRPQCDNQNHISPCYLISSVTDFTFTYHHITDYVLVMCSHKVKYNCFTSKPNKTHTNTDSRPSHFQPSSPSCATHSPQSHPGTPLPQWGLIPSHLQKYHVIFFLEALFFVPDPDGKNMAIWSDSSVTYH